MKEKKKLTQRLIIWGLVVAVLVTGLYMVFGRTSEATAIKLAELPVLGFFGIRDESTTETDIRRVEIELNNTLISQDYAVKLFLATEDNYDHMIDTAKNVISAYKENKDGAGYGFTYSFDYATSTFSYECGEDIVTPSFVYNQDTIMETLEADKDIFPNVLSMDIVLYTDYDKYYDDAMASRLVDLDTYLSTSGGTANDLTKTISQEFLEAVRVGSTKGNTSVFGIPSVHEVGQYEFMVFDQEVLDKYSAMIKSEKPGSVGFSKQQMYSLEDLEDYLRYITAANSAEGTDDADKLIPMLNTPSTCGVLELTDGGALGVSASGEIMLPYSYALYTDYYATITEYRSLGYVVNDDTRSLRIATEDDIVNEEYAVAFFCGTISEMKSLVEKAAGDDADNPERQLVYNIYSYPIATSQEIGEAIFAISSGTGYGNADNEKNAVNFIRLLNGNVGGSDIKNILLYGGDNVHYSLSNDGKVIPVQTYDDGVDMTYSMSDVYTGHTFHALPSDVKGISAETIANASEHNSNLVLSLLAGYSPTEKTFTIKDYAGHSTTLNDTPIVFEDENGESVTLELSYFDAIEEVVAEFYSAYVSGYLFYVDANSDEYRNTQDSAMLARLEDEMLDEFKASVQENYYDEKWAALTAEEIASYEEQAKVNTESELKEQFKNEILAERQAAAEEKGETNYSTNVTDEEIQARLDAYDSTLLATKIKEKYTTLVESAIKVEYVAYTSSYDYTLLIDNYVASAEYLAERDARFDSEYDDLLSETLHSQLSDSILNYGSEVVVPAINAKFAEINAEFIALLTVHYPYVDVDEDITLYTTFEDAFLGLYQSQYYTLKGQPS